METIHFFPIDCEYKIENDAAVVVLTGRTSEGKKICVLDRNVKPYFIVQAEDAFALEPAIKEIEVTKRNDTYKVTGIEHISRKMLGVEKPFLKIFVNIPKGVPHIRTEVKSLGGVIDTFEYDILFVRRYLLDKQIAPMQMCAVTGDFAKGRYMIPCFEATEIKSAEGGETLTKPKILAVDIETYNPHGKLINPEEYPILMLALYGEGFEKVITWKEFATEDKSIEFVKSEIELLEKFAELVVKYQPDIITGYNSDKFDLSYIKTRCKKYKLNLRLGVDESDLMINTLGETNAKITGISHIDIYRFIRRVIGPSMETDSYRLDAVSEELLGSKKVSIDLENFAKDWDENNNLGEYCKYNLQDARLTHDLLVKVLPNLIEFVKIVGLPAYDLSRMSFSQFVEWYVIKQCALNNEIVLNKPEYREKEERRRKHYAGGFVFTPTPGLYKSLVVFDFLSLYPTIIVSHNVSLDTLNCSCCQDAKKSPVEGSPFWFCEKKKGFIPTIMEDLITRRMRIKELLRNNKDDSLLHARSMALKLLTNSFYGYLGFYAARWYSGPAAASVTAWGRHYIQDTIKKAESSGFGVVYGDTDSVFLQLKDKTKDEALDFVDMINKELPGLMELEFEGYFPAGIFVSVKGVGEGAKKKYALLDEKGKLVIKGFESVRRNTSPIAKETQEEVLQILLQEGDSDKALKYVRDVITDLREGKVEADKLVIRTQITKPLSMYETAGPQVATAIKMQEKGIPIGPGTAVRYVVGKGKGRIRDKVTLPEDMQPGEYDADYYIDHQVLPGIERIFAVFGFTEEQIASKTLQKGLGDFF